MMAEYGAFSGMRVGRGNQNKGKKLVVPVLNEFKH
jgi:hypothetical protein